MNKLLIAAVALIPTTFIMMLRFDSWWFCLALVVSIAVAANEYVKLLESREKNLTVGELLDKHLGPKAKNKVRSMPREEKEKLAEHFAKEIGSDTQPICLKNIKKYSINGEKE